MGKGPERRRAFRFINGDLRFEAALEIGRRELPAAILDESASGISVLVEEDPGVEVDEVLRLRTDAWCCEARVANVGPVGKGDKPRGYRLGLHRVRDLEPDSSAAETTPWTAASQPIMPGRSMVGSLLFILALVAAVPLIGAGIMFGLDEARLRQWGDWAGVGSRPARSDPWSNPLRRFLQGEVKGESFPRTSGGSSPEIVGLPRGEQLRSMLTHLRGADALLLPQVARELTLDPDQQRQLQELASATNQTLARFDQYTRGDTRDERIRKRELLFQEARQKALQVLTPEQRARWETLQAP